MSGQATLSSGALDRRITLLRRGETGKDAWNNPILDWAPLATVWAAKRDVSDEEKLRSSQTLATLTTRFRIRWSSVVKDLNPKDRVRFDGRDYAIAAVKEIGRRVGLEITATAIVDEETET